MSKRSAAAKKAWLSRRRGAGIGNEYVADAQKHVFKQEGLKSAKQKARFLLIARDMMRAQGVKSLSYAGVTYAAQAAKYYSARQGLRAQLRNWKRSR